MSNDKCVVVIDRTLPQGLMANTAAVLTLSLGKLHPELIGSDNCDYNGEVHTGITTIPIPILSGTTDEIVKLRSLLKNETTLIDFSNVAQSTKNYRAYSEKLAVTKSEEITYLGILVFGPKKIVNKHTGQLRLVK